MRIGPDASASEPSGLFFRKAKHPLRQAASSVFRCDRSTVKNCILMDDVYVGDDVWLENCIVDKKTKIANGTHTVGDPNEIPILSE